MNGNDEGNVDAADVAVVAAVATVAAVAAVAAAIAVDAAVAAAGSPSFSGSSLLPENWLSNPSLSFNYSVIGNLGMMNQPRDKKAPELIRAAKFN